MSACEMGGDRTEPAPWFLRLAFGTRHPGPAPVPEDRDRWGPTEPRVPAPDPALERLVALVAPVVTAWVGADDVRQVIDELCFQVGLALRRGEAVTLPALGTLSRGAEGVSYQPAVAVRPEVSHG